MKKSIFIAFSLIWTIIGFSQIRIVNPTYEFGNIFEEKGIVYAEFELINPYLEDSIFITSIETTCGCMLVESIDSTILPHSKFILKVSYNPDGRVGLFHKSIQINSITGQDKKNKLFLKLGGNVVPKNKQIEKNSQLINYEVAPIYFYPITVYDTSYLDFNYIKDFVNALTYEIDFYQFSNVGIEVKVRNNFEKNKLNYLIRFIKYKLIREMKKRGYGTSTIFFKKTNFIIDNTIKKWAVAEVRLFSVSFNNDNLNDSNIKLTQPKSKKTEDFFLYLKTNKKLEIDRIKDSINFNKMVNILFKDSVLRLSVNYKSPESDKIKGIIKFEKMLSNMIYKELKELSGIDKNELIITFDSVKYHASTQYLLKIEENSKYSSNSKIKYQVEDEKIVSPLLPTYKQQFFSIEDNIDENSDEFIHFWTVLTTYSKSSTHIKLIIESSTSHYPKANQSDLLYSARQRSTKIKDLLIKKYFAETGIKIKIEVLNVLQGPKWEGKLKYSKFNKKDYFQYEYIKLIPIFTNDRQANVKNINGLPYMVNYDYYFKGVDTTSFVFKRFANYLIYEIQTKGFISLKTESSASNIPIDRKKTNYFIAYEHLSESKKRLNDYLSKRLIDPNRLIIEEENIIVQGIPYSKKTPIVRYKKYQFVKLIPTKYINSNIK